MTAVGFTGTRRGMTGDQAREVWYRLRMLSPSTLHHGASPEQACADWQADKIARLQHIDVVRHPPAARSSAAMLRRNREIVAACSTLIAAPGGYAQEQRSGTWATLREARKRGVPFAIVWPDGQVSEGSFARPPAEAQA